MQYKDLRKWIKANLSESGHVGESRIANNILFYNLEKSTMFIAFRYKSQWTLGIAFADDTPLSIDEENGLIVINEHLALKYK